MSARSYALIQRKLYVCVCVYACNMTIFLYTRLPILSNSSNSSLYRTKTMNKASPFTPLTSRTVVVIVIIVVSVYTGWLDKACTHAPFTLLALSDSSSNSSLSIFKRWLDKV